jgi:serine/threonine protein kinase
VREEDIANEVRAIQKLCEPDKGKHLVQVFHHEAGAGSHLQNDLYQIDMELCVGNLNEMIQSQASSLRDLVQQMSDQFDASELEKLLTKFEEENKDIVSQRLFTKLQEKNKEVIYIMLQILEGLAFIHSKGEVHRDLKPENGPPQSQRVY